MRARTLTTIVAIAVVAAIPALGAASATRTIPNGVYRAHVSVQQLRAAGVVPSEARGNGGIQTLTIRDGRWTFSVLHIPPDCHGTLAYPGQRVLFIQPGRGTCGVSGGRFFDAHWVLTKGQLRFSDIRPHDVLFVALFGLEPWKKIG